MALFWQQANKLKRHFLDSYDILVLSHSVTVIVQINLYYYATE